MSRAYLATASVSVKFGTERLLALVNEEIEKAISQNRNHLRAALGLIAALKDRCCLLDQELTRARSSAVPSSLLMELEHIKDELENLREALARGGFILDSDNVIKFGPVFSTLALDFSGVSSQSMGLSTSLEGVITSQGVIDLLGLMRRTLEENDRIGVAWKDKCIALEKERDELKAEAIEPQVLKSKDSEIDNLRNEVNLLKGSLASYKQQAEHSPSTRLMRISNDVAVKQSRSKGPPAESSDSDVPLALTSKPLLSLTFSEQPVKQSSTLSTSADEERSSTFSDTREHAKVHSPKGTTLLSPMKCSKKPLLPSASESKDSTREPIEFETPLFDDTIIACPSPPSLPPLQIRNSRAECEESSKTTPAEKMQMSTPRQANSPIIIAVSSSFPTSPLQQVPAPKTAPDSDPTNRKTANDDINPASAPKSSVQSKPLPTRSIDTPTVRRLPRAALSAVSKPLLAIQSGRNGSPQTPTSVDNKPSNSTSGSSNFIPKQLPLDLPKVNKVTLGTGKPKTAPKTLTSVEQSKTSSQKLPSFNKSPQKPVPTPSSTRQLPPLRTSSSAKRASTSSSTLTDRPVKRIRAVSNPEKLIPILPRPPARRSLPTNNKVSVLKPFPLGLKSSIPKQASTSSRPAHSRPNQDSKVP